MEQNIHTQNSSGNVLVKKLGLILSVFVFLLPVFFVPVLGVNLYVAKITFLVTGLVVMFVIFLSSVLSTGVIEVPKAKYLIPIVFFALVSVASSIFSGAISNSIIGSIFDLGTSGSILLLVFTMLITILASKSVGIVSKVLQFFIYSAVILAVYTLLRTFGVSLLPEALASKAPSLLLGSSIDTAIIFGAAVILSLCAINMTEISKRNRMILFALMFYSMVFIGSTNFLPVIVVLSIVSLIFFVYMLSWSMGDNKAKYAEGGQIETWQPQNNAQINRKISLSSLIILIVSVLFLLGGTNISGYISKVIKVQSIEIRPNFQTTMNLTVDSWQKNFIFGVGPNRFSKFWSLHKPIEVNQTQFWNSEFYFGSGFIPTVAVTTGLLGILSLLVFIGMYVISGVKAIFAQANALRSRYLATSSFLASFYLWVVLFFYTPSISILALAFIFTGLFTSTIVHQGIVSVWKVNIFSNPKTNFLSVLSIVVLLILSITGGYFVWERAVATVVFEQGVLKYQKTGDVASIKKSTIRAISMVPSDIYWRSLAEIHLIDLGKVLGGAVDQSGMSDSVKIQAQSLITASVESAKKAISYDNNNFENWFTLGRVYEILATNGIGGSVENARNAYTEATFRSPTNPSVSLAMARLDILTGNIDGVRVNINKSLELKRNYTDAYFTLAQFEVSQNNIPNAVQSVEMASLLDSNNSGLYFQLGLLKYNQNDFVGASKAFERSLEITHDYANAKYFLGLSYENLKRRSDAIKQFEDLEKTNPNSPEVKFILTNLRAGKSPFTNALPPINSKPEDRKKPPIEE